jgi:hypothetical protein
MNINKSIEPIEVNIQYGEANRKQSLQAYKCENELKKAVAQKERAVIYHLFNKFQIPFQFDVKVSEPGEKLEVEYFTILELINNKLTSANSSLCLSTYEIYQKDGIEKAIENLHLKSSLTII